MSDQAHDHGHGDGHDGDGGPQMHVSFSGYMTGFLLSIVLTAIPFGLVMGHVISDTRTMSIVLLVFAAAQIFVHMVYFLHMNTRDEGGWNLLALLFTIMLVVITLAGTLWVMFHLDENMMPMAPHDARTLP